VALSLREDEQGLFFARQHSCCLEIIALITQRRVRAAAECMAKANNQHTRRCSQAQRERELAALASVHFHRLLMSRQRAFKKTGDLIRRRKNYILGDERRCMTGAAALSLSSLALPSLPRCVFMKRLLAQMVPKQPQPLP